MFASLPRYALTLMLLVWLAGCVSAAALPAPDLPAAIVVPTSTLAESPAQTPVAAAAPVSSPTLIPVPTPPSAALRLEAGPDLTITETNAITAALADRGVQVTLVDAATPDRADLRLNNAALDDGRLMYEHILVPVTRFPAHLDEVTSGELVTVWGGHGKSPHFKTLYVADDALEDLVALWGPPGPAVHTLKSNQMADTLWRDAGGLGILPFDALTVRTRALRLDGLSAVDNRLDARRWPLAARGWLHSVTPQGAAALDKLDGTPILTNRDPARLTVLVTTGVTALTRGTAAAIERAHDDAFPARLVGPELAAADLTTTSNEVSFVENCPVDNRAGVMQFCSRPGYLDSLTLTGVDLVGLTGNHLNDYGTAAFTRTLNLYAQHGIRTYGGGQDEKAAAAPLTVTDHGNRLAFLGANQFGPAGLTAHNGDAVSAWAGPHSPGSARYDRTQMLAAIQDARKHADVVLAELQWTEFNAAGDYVVDPLPNQLADFRALSDAGAGIVTGVQAHAPQAMELRGQGIILYGLGNLYFDQTFSWPTRTGIVARHTIYAGRLLNTELLITVIDANKQVRWATPAERVSVLKSVFGASGW
jgi:hypothetical protein